MFLSDLLAEAALVERPLVERVDSLGSAVIEKYRKDFLVLLGNVKRVRSYEDAERLRSGIRSWREHYYDHLGQIRRDIESRKRDVPGNIPVPEREIASAVEYMGPAWSLASELMDFPLRVHRPGDPYSPSRERAFADYEREAKKWEARVRRKATAAWKALDYLSKWAKNWTGGGEEIRVRTKEVQHLRVEGFAVRLVGFEGEDFEGGFLPLLHKGLRAYRERARKILPVLVKKQLPLVILAETGSGEAAASYHGSYIEVTRWGHATEDTRAFVHVMAHEMGHHIYKTHLSGQAREVWVEFVRGGTTTLDLRDVIKRLSKYGGRMSFIDDDFQKEEPILALQLQGLQHDPAYGGSGGARFLSVSDLQSYLERGNDPIVRVNRSPVTGYGAKNPEEAFCDAVGRLVGYGPRTVLPEVVRVLRSVLPELRMEDVAMRLSDRLEEALLVETGLRGLPAGRRSSVGAFVGYIGHRLNDAALFAQGAAGDPGHADAVVTELTSAGANLADFYRRLGKAWNVERDLVRKKLSAAQVDGDFRGGSTHLMAASKDFRNARASAEFAKPRSEVGREGRDAEATFHDHIAAGMHSWALGERKLGQTDRAKILSRLANAHGEEARRIRQGGSTTRSTAQGDLD